MEIIILRHGKPVIPPLKKITSYEFCDWVKKYNQASLSLYSIPNKSVLDRAVLTKVIASSVLPRSIQSADAITTHQFSYNSALFNEVELPVVNWGRIKLSPRLWAIILRIIWLLGFSTGSESYKESKERAMNAVLELERLSTENGSVLLVGHGVYNRIIANELRSKSWKGPANPGRKYWSFAVYTK